MRRELETRMEEAQFREIVRDNLVPMLQGTLDDQTLTSTSREGLASYTRPTRIVVKPSRTAGFRVAIDRSQAFSPVEKELVGQFIAEVAAVTRVNAGEYVPDLLKAIPRRVVAAHLGGGELLRSVLERLEEWSSQTYEGQRIVAAIALDNADSTSRVALSDLWEQPFGPVLSNGFDTVVVVGRNGRIDRFEQLSSNNESSTAPYRLREIACWAQDGRTSVVLNRHGEILVFQDRSLRFARRSGSWLHYVHDANIKRLSPPQNTHLRRAIYESCLDVSFARTGGCVGVIGRDHTTAVAQVVGRGDLLANQSSFKTTLLERVIGRSRFQDLDRRSRLELMSLDGAVVLDLHGKLLAAGAIVEVQGGSIGGGRTAAARKLSTLGIGIKVSADGSITGYRGNGQILRT